MLALSWRSQIPEARLPAGSAYHPPFCLSRLVSFLRSSCVLRLLCCTWRPHCCTWRAPSCRPQPHSCLQRISCPCATSVPGVMFRRTFKNNPKRACKNCFFFCYTFYHLYHIVKREIYNIKTEPLSFNFPYTANEGQVRIQYKCLVPIYVFPEMKLIFP
jgi:hypothetical protein